MTRRPETPTFLDPQLLLHVEQAIADIRNGKMIILVDDEDRENEGDLTIAAEHATPEVINFMAKHGRGLICLTLTEEQIEKLDLPMMPQGRGGPKLGTAFTLSIEARRGVTTGISAADRARTIQAAIARDARPDDVVTPGHIFPLKARAGGVLVRTGQTEGSVDLAVLAGLIPAGVICEIMNDDGTMARLPDLEVFAAQYDMKILTIADLIRYRLHTENLVRRQSEHKMALDETGTEWRVLVYGTSIGSAQFVALVKGDPAQAESTLCRMHSGSLVSDVFGSTLLEGRSNLRRAIRRIEQHGHGVIVYIPPKQDAKAELDYLADADAPPVSEFRGEENESSAPPRAALREFGLGAQVLTDLGLKRIRLLTNHPRKIAGLGAYGLEVLGYISLGPEAC
jgi:3,4-dihydroxy 2-butanone 4-phosphate synthase / GTP cyclohydrolase II